MPNEIRAFGLTSEALTFRAWNAARQVWNGSAFVAYVTANEATYVFTMTAPTISPATTREVLHTGDFPTAIAAGVYSIQLLVGGIEESEYEIYWNGTLEITLDNLASLVEPGETLLQTMRLVRAVLAGVSDATDPQAGTVVFNRKDGTTTALTGTYNAQGDRTAITVGTV